MPEINPLQIRPPPGTPEANNPLAPDWMRNIGSAAAGWVQRQHLQSQAMGLEDPATGLPTQRGLLNALQQYPAALVAGSGGSGEGGFSLEQIHPRTLRPLSSAVDLGQPGAHAYSIRDPQGEPVGIVDTEWSPDTGNLHIADIQSNEGANSLGLGAIRQVRDLLIARYPNVKTLSGQRITGAVSADRASGSGPGRTATQAVRTRQDQGQ